ncbi:MAG: flagellar type III secretion system protein FlhB [Rubrimonas sp.]|uniref:EscU/YscU/HrcU family type III secretion system export apparatus switch protein n=1 Tax=Rubrimonas sp. TaxID=2036015 RepID=UPI002FDD277D
MAEDGDQGQDKSFEPTERKLDQAREKGDVPRSIDVNAAAAYLAFLGMLLTLGAAAAEQFTQAAMVFLGSVDRLEGRILGPGGLALAGWLTGKAALATAPVFLAPAAAVLASLLAQRAIVASTEKLKPKLSRIDPIEVAGNKFGPTGIVEFLKSAAKMALISTALWWWLIAHAEQLVRTAGMEARALPSELSRMGVSLLTLVAAISVAIAAVDFLWQRYDHARKLRMSLEDLRKESKEVDGDPYMKQARRARAEAIATNQMLQQVPKADVVIVNPTHYAVALKWDRKPGAAPRCVAKGVDAVAAQIRARAMEAGVPIHRDPPTARTLHATVDLGKEVHPDHYRAVAAAIRFAEDIRRRAREQGFRPRPRAD